MKPSSASTDGFDRRSERGLHHAKKVQNDKDDGDNDQNMDPTTRSIDRVAITLAAQQDEDAGGNGKDRQNNDKAA
jgi:hypothetical protein